MCLAVPMRITAIDGLEAEVDIGGTRRSARLDIVDGPVGVGDYVLVHAGYAIHVIDETEARQTLRYFEEILAEDDSAFE